MAAVKAAIQVYIRVHPRESAEKKLDVQVLHVQRILFDELAPRFHVFSHQRGEDRLALGDVLEPDR